MRLNAAVYPPHADDGWFISDCQCDNFNGLDYEFNRSFTFADGTFVYYSWR